MEPIRVELKIGDRARGGGELGPYAVTVEDEILIGRQAEKGLYLDEEWTPRVLARLVPAGPFWLLINGPRWEVEVRNAAVKTRVERRAIGKGKDKRWEEVAVGATFAKEAAIVLAPGAVTTADWRHLNDNVRLTLVVGGDVEGLTRLLPEDEPYDGVRLLGARTDIAAGAGRARSRATWTLSRVHGAARRTRSASLPAATAPPSAGDLLTSRQRQVMAAVYRFMLEGLPRPANPAKDAAVFLGMDYEGVRKHIRDVRRKVNKQRDGDDLPGIDDLGEWLVNKMEIVTRDDLWKA